MNVKIMIIALSISVVSGMAHADYTKKWCQGEISNQCPIQPHVPCIQDGGPTDVQKATTLCTVHSSNGQEVLKFTVETVSSQGGNKCGYTVYQVTCLTK